MSFFKDKKYEAMRQLLLVWLIIYSIPAIEHLASLRRYEHYFSFRRHIVFLPFATLCIAAPIVGHYYLLYRRYAMTRRYKLYFQWLPVYLASVIVLDFLSSCVTYFWIYPEDGLSMHSAIKVALLRVIFADMAVAYVYAVIRQQYAIKRTQKALEAEQHANEIKLLRSKLPPSFITNVLNTLMDEANAENAPETARYLQQVNDLFHYSTDQATAETISLADELAFIGRYVQLQKKRIASDSSVTVKTSLAAEGTAQIAPMLLLPFVENAFKYGVSYELPSRIGITAKIHNGILLLEVENTDHAGWSAMVSTRTGLANVTRRLELQYRDKYELVQRRENGLYSVSLKLNLN